MFRPRDEAEQTYFVLVPDPATGQSYQPVIPVSLIGGLLDLFAGPKRTTAFVLPSSIPDKLYIRVYNPLKHLEEQQQNLYK